MPESSSNEIPLRLILMGTGPFAVPSFDKLLRDGNEIALVVTRPQPPVKSRKEILLSPVRSWAAAHGIEIYDPENINDSDAIERIRSIGADLLVVCDYGQILKPETLATTRLGGINLHGSLLPAYRGAAPVQRALLSGDHLTGVSVIHMTPKLDGGPLISVRDTLISDTETAGELEVRLSEIGVDATSEAVDRLRMWDLESSFGVRQDPSKATRAPRLSKAEGEINWDREARMIDCHVRGMQPWPIAFFYISVEGKQEPLRVAVKRVVIGEKLDSKTPPGMIATDEGLRISAKDHWVEILSLQPAGKRDMTAAEFLRGHRLSSHSI